MEWIGNRYEIEHLINEGGMGKVYRAIDQTIGRRVAIKFIHTNRGQDETVRKRFIKEVQAVIRIDHHAIVPIYDFGNEAGDLWFAMKYMERGSLADLMGAPHGQPFILAVMNRICAAVDRLHQAGYIHRDIKPGNILIDQYGDAYLGDFGITKSIWQGEDLTGSRFIGTPKYMSPEQFESGPSGQLSPASDIYSLTVVLFEMLCGANPFEGKTTGQLIKEKLDGPLPLITNRVNDLPSEINAVLQKGTEVDPKDRYPSAKALLQGIQEAFNLPATKISDQDPYRTDTTIKMGKEKSTRWPAVVVASLILVAALTISGYYFIQRGNEVASIATPLPQAIVAVTETDRPPPTEATALPVIVIESTPTSDLTLTADPTATPAPLPTETDIPTLTPTAQPTYITVPLERFSDLAEPAEDLGIEIGEVVLGEVPFDFGWKMSTRCGNTDEALARIAEISIPTAYANPKKVHILFQGGDMRNQYRDQAVGYFELQFNNAAPVESRLTAGFNIRDWQRQESELVITELAPSSNVVGVHTYPFSEQQLGGLDLLTIELKDAQQMDTLTAISIFDTSTQASPCIHIFAITIEV